MLRADELGWQGMTNGELLHAAEEAGFDLLLTCEQLATTTANRGTDRHRCRLRTNGPDRKDRYRGAVGRRGRVEGSAVQSTAKTSQVATIADSKRVYGE